MTITSSTNQATFQGTGAQTVFNFGFIWGDPSYMTVTTVVSGVTTVLTPSQFTLSLNPAVPGSIWGVGGSVTYPLVGSPLAVGSTITIARQVPYLQTVSLSNQGSQTPQSMEEGMDLLEMQLQQDQTFDSYGFSAPTTDPTAPLPVPPASVRANQMAVFDGNGNLTSGTLPASGTISTAMQPVVNAATVALGRTALGLGALALENFGSGLGDDGSGNARVNQTITVGGSNESVTSAFAWTLRVASTAVTYAFPAGSTLWNGFTLQIAATNGGVTLTINGADSFLGQSAGASYSVPSGYVATISCDGATNATWYVRLALIAVSNAAVPVTGPTGRLTLTSATPVLSSAVLTAGTMYFTPFGGNSEPVWNGSSWVSLPLPEISALLSDVTYSPAAAVAGGIYDWFVWQPTSGSWALSRSPVWTNTTTRALALTRVNGLLTNASPITNGPAAGYGLYVGTSVCDAGGATVTFNPNPSPASTGPALGAWIGLWNQYNSTGVSASEQDSKVSWTPTASWGAADASTNNRITFVTGQAQDGISAAYFAQIYSLNASNYAYVGIGLDSTTTPSVAGTVQTGSGSSGGNGTVNINLSVLPQIGKHYIQALEIAGSGSPVIYGGSGGMQLSAQLRY